jgi:hypothetical protein
VTQPLREGFGTSFVKRGLEYEMQGSAVAEPALTGLGWRLEFPVAGNVQLG